ncbi:carbamoylphosphate synthase large subunit short form [Geoanaerobacter pelophilus]|uniref:Carbamoylphosphate synthase large subunit short form n=1 Tax=Geoanaerobacter pelophilus TaxID=60036 RepID=A0ABQ0MHU6_9BACT|nr:ATP-grasp domain-containing protein [Geoanaerobacter pelophilus]GAW66660.1 carbamoylphosphate synthase large subunit short form [Geoanaerobacter pelophilus]
MKKFNVLVFPGGTEIGLEVHRSLHLCKEVTLFSAGTAVSNHAPYVFARHATIRSIFESGWIGDLNRVIAEFAIDYIFPAYDDVIVALAENAAKIQARIVTSPLDTCLVARSKSRTYNRLADAVPTPALYAGPESVSSYPVFVKPDQGQGAQDTHRADSPQQLLRLLQERPGRIALEYLPGREYTVDCFSDREAGLLFCSGRERVRMKSGIAMSSRVSKEQEIFAEYAAKIASRLAFHGAWFFQLKEDREGVLKLLEVAPRIAGTMALHRVLGVNFPLLSLYEQERMPLTIMTNGGEVEIDRSLVNRYRHDVDFSTAYVDLDDTLILNHRVNLQVVAFIYQCLNNGKKVVLLTKHEDDLAATLARHRLTGLFCEIVHLKKSDAKADFIREGDAILIDDSFSERKAATERLGIKTFDCSMLEMLMDGRS